jgi:beta-N-acetylhexosaminidase
MELLKLEEMTVEQKVGMLLCARRFWKNTDDVDFILELVKKRALGCVQAPFNQPEIIKKIKETADYPIILVNDTERGYPTSPRPKVPLISLAATGNKEYIRSFARCLVADAKADNCNGTWGPVIDVLHSDGPARVFRILSDDPQKVAELSEEIARVFNENHYFSCGKHYPGDGIDGVDTHMMGEYNDFTEEEIIAKNLVPYIHLWKKGLLPSIMVGHTTCTKIDPDYPSSLSKKVIDIIRNMGYDGVMFTDSFAMMAILQEFGEEKLYGMAVNAGIDIVLPNYMTPVRETYELLLQNYKDGVFTEERLNEAVRRVLNLMEFVATEPETPLVITKEDEENLAAISRDCITAVCDEGLTAAIGDVNKKRLFIVLTENDFEVLGEGEEITVSKWYYPNNIAKKIKKEFPNSSVMFLKEFSSAAENDKTLRTATAYDEVVFVTFCTTTCYLGTDSLTRRTESVINALAFSKKLKTIVHFGNPHALLPVLHIPRKIFGYMIPESQEYAIDILAGKLEAKGTLPFNIQYK